MIINSEQEMLEFGKGFVDYMTSTGGRAEETPDARSRKASTMGETARPEPVEPLSLAALLKVSISKSLSLAPVLPSPNPTLLKIAAVLFIMIFTASQTQASF